ncbi:hypothetical protein SSCHL_2348 [Staphylococcus schleiferi]|nr:hypothetical protein SSCHL_2348 [Staphylococcus schleiferi]
MTQFNLDTVHSTFGFSIKHLMVSKIRGTFKDYDIQLTGDVEDASSLSAIATIKVDSVDTGNADRDQHLKTKDFFDSETYPEIKFESTQITENQITGHLTIAGQTHEETFDFTHNGVSANPMTGGQVTGFVVRGTINREKYGISFNQTLETGGVMLGKDIQFELDSEFAIEA